MADIDNDITEVKPLITEATWGFLVLRFWIGLRMLFAGAEKFYAYAPIDPETGEKAKEMSFASGHAIITAKDNILGVVRDNAFLPLNPSDLLMAFGVSEDKIGFLKPIQPDLWFAVALPYLLLFFGVFLILGILPRLSLFMAGIIFMLLSIGLMSLPDAEGIMYLGVHVGLVAVAMCLVRHSRFNLTKF